MRKKITQLIILLLLFFTMDGKFCLAETKSKDAEIVTLEVHGSKIPLGKAEMEEWISEKSRLEPNDNYQSEIENTYYCRYKKSIVCQLSFSLKGSGHIQKKTERKINEEKVGAYVIELAKKTNIESRDAKFNFDKGKVSAFSLSAPGKELEEQKAKEIIIRFLAENSGEKIISLPYKEILPGVNIDNIENMGITELLGEGKSNFAGSPKNRVHNLSVGAKRFNGVLIKPNEEFSFIKTLGPVDESTGYLPELVIKKDQTIPEFGGGMCQVSTTAFRAAINSGLKITQRTNHAYPVSYYNPQGMDATVYIPRPDLRFVNNTPGYILIQTKIVGTQLFFDFYGTSDGRKVEIEGPTVLERNPDGSMKTVFKQIVKDKEDNVIISDSFKSNYDSPDKYPHPGQETIIRTKPKNWSDREWREYKKEHGL